MTTSFDDIAVENGREVSPLTMTAVTHALRETMGASPIRWQMLSPRPDHNQVARVTVRATSGSESSVVVKYLVDKESGWIRTMLQEEICSYVFLMQLRPRFTAFPRLIYHNEDLFILEDLGEDSYEFETPEALEESLALSMVSMHLASATERERYLRTRETLDLPAPEFDTRTFGAPGCIRGFSIGADWLSNTCGVLYPEGLPALREAIARTLHRIQRPGPFMAFVHDDLAHRRQTCVLDGTFYLFDFEGGKYFHCLCDLATPLVGKIERLYSNLRYIHLAVDLSDDFSRRYRMHWEAMGGPVLSDDLWTEHLNAAMIFRAMLTLAQMIVVSDKPFDVPLPAIMRSVLRRLSQRLLQSNAEEPLRKVLEELQKRVNQPKLRPACSDGTLA